MIEDRDSPPPYQGESRSRSSTTHPRVIIQPLGRFGAVHPIRSAYHWWLTGSEPLQRSGYQQCLSIVISNANGSANRSREIELAQCWLLVPPVESRVPPAWTCVDTAGHEDKPGGHWVVPACVPAYVTGARGVDTATTRGATGVCAASRIRIRLQRFLSEFIRGL